MEQEITQHEAVIIIQKAWRAFANRTIFKCLKEAVLSQNRGDPKLLLRCISIRESNLVESASGLHVRFRLGGEQFPPGIYYKIFTHRPVADICAFGPRNYAQEKRIDEESVESDKSDWYCREENNQWRLVDYLGLQPTIVSGSAATLQDWKQYSKETRDHARRKQMARRKTAWMAWLQPPNIAEEENDLIEWSENLDFEQYLKEWAEIGCSASPFEAHPCFPVE